MSSCGPQASASISPSGFRVRKVERKKTFPQIAIKNTEWNSGPLYHDVHWPGFYSQALPLLTLLLHHRYRTFSYSGFFISTGKLPQQQGWTRPQQPPARTQREQLPLLATAATVLVLLRNLSNISIYTWILSNFNIFNNFCGHVNMAESMDDLKPILCWWPGSIQSEQGKKR